MRLLKRGFSRLLLRVVRFAIVPLELLDARRYMFLYCKVLRLYGLRTVGQPRYIASNAYFDDINLITLGDRTVVSKHVIMLTHDYSVTTALLALGDELLTDVGVKRQISVGNNVFIGMSAILPPGTNLGNNIIVGAGSVVRGTIPDDSIVIGNPAQIIGKVTERETRWRELSRSIHAFSDRK